MAKKISITVDFWHTSIGIFVKRVAFQALATGSLVLYTDMTAGFVDWNKVKFAVATQVLYIVMTVTRDLADPKLANTTGDEVKAMEA